MGSYLGLLLICIVILEFGKGDVATKPVCSHPEIPENGFVTCSRGVVHTSVCTTVCSDGYELEGSSRMLCWCQREKCVWTGTKASCKYMNCDVPNYDEGRVRLLDTWPDGFAGLVEVKSIPTSLRAELGWSIVIVFDRPLGKQATLTSWNTELSATSYDRQTFTLINSKHNVDLTKFKKQSSDLTTLFIVKNTSNEIPKAAYVGLYDHRVRDASCVLAPKMPPILLFGSSMRVTQEEIPPTTTTSSQSVTSKRVPQTYMIRTASVPTKKPIKTTTMGTTKTTTTTEEQKTTTSTTKTTTTTTAPQTEFDGNYCRLQTHTDYYVTDKGWEDRGQHSFSADISLKTRDDLNDWSMVVVFDTGITKIQVWACKVLDHSEDGTMWNFIPNPGNPNLNAGIFNIRLIVTQAHATVGLPTAQIYLCSSEFTSGDAVMSKPDTNDDTSENEVTTNYPLKTMNPGAPQSTITTAAPKDGRCSQSSPSGRPAIRAKQIEPKFLPNNDGTKYNYNELLHKSILFYEAQRSGPLPANQRVPWRGDSDLKDGCDIGVDLTGGWHDAGDGVKFSFPMAFSLTTLAWGAIEFRDAYKDAGELENMIECVKWPVKYFIESHLSKHELVGQVGHGQTDHNYWGRPEEFNIYRKTYKITEEEPGSELAAEVAASLAASSIFLNETDPDLSSEALRHAEELFEFADKFRGLYHVAIPDAMKFYKSYSGYEDELLWAAVWLYKATMNDKYLVNALRKYDSMNWKYRTAKEFSWDDKMAGAQALLADLTGKADFRKPFARYLDNMQRVDKTPQGMYYLMEWGSNRYAANAAFMAIMGAKMSNPLPRKQLYLSWASKQINLLLGNAGRSYVVGFGENPPRRAHHKASSCPPYPARCDWAHYHTAADNPYILYGALVGGPNIKGEYTDNRQIFTETEVACDYNAGFQSAIAGLKHFVMKKNEKAKATIAEVTTTTTEASTTLAEVSTTAAYIESTTRKVPCKPKRSRRCIKAARLARKKQRLI